MLAMEKDFDSKLRIEGNNNSSTNCPTVQRSKSFAFRAPQEHFSIQDFELGKIYGVGSYSKVVRAKKIDTGTVYALKIMDKKFITKENKTAYVKLERIVLDQLDHPGVVRLFFTFQDTFSLCGELFDQITSVRLSQKLPFLFHVIMESTLCLKSFLLKSLWGLYSLISLGKLKGHLSEDEARFYTAEVVDALEYIHSMGLIHRDIKPENLLLTADGHIKIADFGSVKPMQDSRITVLPNAASDDKACTFVGTAAYVPPEVLNSSPATFGNDLWALGCTLYQMLSGTSPFKDTSEWLIFQRIIARDIRFPNYFSDAARDLIDRLLDVDPSRRPGAGPGGYAVLKMHHFFKGIDWKNIRGQTPPKLASEPMVQSGEGDDVHDSSWNPSHIGDISAKINDGNGGASSSEGSITRLASIDSFDSKWQQFLDPGESVLMISMVKKLQKLTSKKVQLILTNKPKLIYVDPSKLVVKGNIIWSDNSNDLSIQVSSPSHFKIVTVFPLLPFYPPGCISKSDIFKLLQSFTVNCVIVLSTDDNLKTMNVTLCSTRPSNSTKSLNIIKEVSRKGQYNGPIRVVPPEDNAFFWNWGCQAQSWAPICGSVRYVLISRLILILGQNYVTESVRSSDTRLQECLLKYWLDDLLLKLKMMFDAAERRFRVGKLNGKKAINVTCGSGIANAAAVTQDMLDHFDIMDIVHFGIAGNTYKLSSSSSSSWRNPNAKLNSNYAANLDVNNYNVPKGHGSNHLGHIGYNSEQLFPSQGSLMMLSPCCGSQSMSSVWLKLAANLRGAAIEPLDSVYLNPTVEVLI
ncbi:3-phosphoinositide-dependent protein kinase 2 [Citrus sinensis]|nr:3-phosphoinositide-dependent protein kinase 2 [Citrus sinensis]